MTSVSSACVLGGWNGQSGQREYEIKVALGGENLRLKTSYLYKDIKKRLG